jgi:hypothetical protein
MSTSVMRLWLGDHPTSASRHGELSVQHIERTRYNRSQLEQELRVRDTQSWTAPLNRQYEIVAAKTRRRKNCSVGLVISGTLLGIVTTSADLLGVDSAIIPRVLTRPAHNTHCARVQI